MRYRANIAGPGWSKTWLIEAETDAVAREKLKSDIHGIFAIPQDEEIRRRQLAATVSLKAPEHRLVLRRSIVDMVVHQ